MLCTWLAWHATILLYLLAEICQKANKNNGNSLIGTLIGFCLLVVGVPGEQYRIGRNVTPTFQPTGSTTNNKCYAICITITVLAETKYNLA